MAAYNKFNATVNDLATKVHNLHSDVLKVLFTNTLPVAANAVKADIAEIAAGNGYTAGGPTAALSSDGQTAGLYKLKLVNALVTATGVIGPFQYAILYNSTAASGNLLGWWDYGSAVTMGNTDTFTVQFDASNGVITLQ